jgi:hypothetical protein
MEANYMKPVVLFRKHLAEEGEFEVCQNYFETVELRTKCKDNLVIGRYACLPHYNELAADLCMVGSRLINSPQEHRWIANFNWYDQLKDYTPRTWFGYDFNLSNCCDYNGPFVVKGRTNSKKFQWNKMMFARDKLQATNIACDLMADSYIGEQGIVFREYVPLETYEIGVNGLPFTNEWRMFFHRDILLSCGYYWSIAEKTDYECPPEAIAFATEVAKIAKSFATFFVLDVAKTEDGRWILIEVNDGQQSGLSENNPHMLYKNLATVVNATY